MLKAGLLATALLAVAAPAALAQPGDSFTVTQTRIADRKAVFATVESIDTVAARARISGTIGELRVDEGDAVAAGDVLAVVVDDRLAPQIGAVNATASALQAQLDQATVGDELQVLFHHGGVHAEHTAGHGVAGILDFQLGAFQDHLGGLVAHLGIPQVRVFNFNLIDDINSKIYMH